MKYPRYSYSSLTQKIMIAIALWLIGAVFFIGLTMHLTWKLEDHGKAINEAGSLRKQMYLVVTALQAGENVYAQQQLNVFEQKLDRLSAMNDDLSRFNRRSQVIDNQLQHIRSQFAVFQQRALAARQQPQLQRQLFKDLPQFVNVIETFVKNLENENTRNIQMIRLAQGLLMLMAIISAFLSKIIFNQMVINPLNILNNGLKNLRKGNLYTRLDIQSNDEFHQVSDGFNQMADSLQDLYQNLEHKVSQKTAELEQKHAELNILYETAIFFHQEPVNNKTLSFFLEKVMILANAPAASIHLINQDGRQVDNIVSVNVPTALLDIVNSTYIKSYLSSNDAEPQVMTINPVHHLTADSNTPPEYDPLIVYPIQSKDKISGLLTFYFPYEQNRQTDPVELPLIRLLCNQLSNIFENYRLGLKAQQYAVLEERNLMAQGLHDSIAQSLSFLNIQLQMLKKALPDEQPAKIMQHLSFLDRGIQECYDDVRELLQNFRLKLKEENFYDALTAVIEQFKQQLSIEVQLNYQTTGAHLTPQQQLQLIFITQEAFSNIRKHAQASHVDIDFIHDKSIILRIHDNGVGFDTGVNKERQGRHIGLSIMRERIGQIHGTIEISSIPNGGTTIEAVIPAQH